MNPCVVFVTVANRRRSFAEAALLCALIAEGAAEQPTKTTSGALLRRCLPPSFNKKLLQRAAKKLADEGLVSASVLPNTRTTYTVATAVLDDALNNSAVEASSEQVAPLARLTAVLHQFGDYDEAVLLCRLLEIPAADLPQLSLSAVIEPFAMWMDRFRAHRVLKRLAARGFVTLESKPRAGVQISLAADAAAELLARPLPNLRYLRPDAFASQPYFIARAARLASAGADGQSVELGAADLAVSDVESRADLSAARAQAAAVDDAASTSLST
ncbi:MAG: hypothetical protein EKK53_05980 [Burkholderiales bacterium]|jgi:hypothetical protein|nr:MAG: hypothetical protein EKK53_05980 [Burkholderiales bacterium]|mmetsp:Transcript_53314/g.125357  ORF Transcript_53314/g.125357 Transcript_53314/m.125357 type:complete len:272 (+) Transcript_53314:1282-2097(+)